MSAWGESATMVILFNTWIPGRKAKEVWGPLRDSYQYCVQGEIHTLKQGSTTSILGNGPWTGKNQHSLQQPSLTWWLPPVSDLQLKSESHHEPFSTQRTEHNCPPRSWTLIIGPNSNWESLEEAKEMKTVHDAKFIYNFSRLVLHPRSVPCPVKWNSSER